MKNENAGKRGRMTPLLLVAALFALPFAASWIMYFGGWMPFTPGNKGELISPIIELPEQILSTAAGGGVDVDSLRGSWVFLYVTGDRCDDDCVRAAYEMRQVRLALAENAPHVQRLIVTADKDATEKSVGQFPGTRIIVDGGVALRVERLLRTAGEPVAGSLYVVDPRGNVILRYINANSPKDLLADMSRLFKTTQFH